MRILIGLLIPVALVACSNHQPMSTVGHVDLERFMGDWYVIANIPTFIEKDAHNAVESYAMNEDGTVDTVFTFRDGGFEGEKRRYKPTGYVLDTKTNARWGMQFIWPIKADYRVVYLDSEYRVTIIGREARDYVWLMAREPSIPDDEYRRLVNYIAGLGYDATQVRRVPQQWHRHGDT